MISIKHLTWLEKIMLITEQSSELIIILIKIILFDCNHDYTRFWKLILNEKSISC